MVPHRLRSIADYHRLRALPPEAHPLVSVVRVEDIGAIGADEPKSLTQDFYTIALKRAPNKTMRYGMGEYTARGGLLYFIAPRQVYALHPNPESVPEGWLLLVHPDLLSDTPLAREIQRFEFFTYAVDEALELDEEEEARLSECFVHLRSEIEAGPSHLSRAIVLSYIELLLRLADRAYGRERSAGRAFGGDLLARLECVLRARLRQPKTSAHSLPTVAEVSWSLGVSPKHLGSVLKGRDGYDDPTVHPSRRARHS